MTPLAYLDTSALVKLVLHEPESAALHAYVAAGDIVTSGIARTEALRTVRRSGERELEAACRRLLDECVVIQPDQLVLEAACTIDPVELRSLDALHLATATRLQYDLTAFVCYDTRLAQAALDHGLTVVSPS